MGADDEDSIKDVDLFYCDGRRRSGHRMVKAFATSTMTTYPFSPGPSLHRNFQKPFIMH